jgi:two-component system, response regulator PdtaR
MKASGSILLVEDEAIIALDLSRKLRLAGYGSVITAATGEDAAAIVLRDAPNVVIMDNHLAGKIDGIEAALRIRAGSDVPIIFMTGYQQDEAFRERVRPVRPVACLDKPIIIEELLKALAAARGA